jgi:hypothetical protein
VKALVLGCAECVWADAAAAAKLFEPDAVFAVKAMIAHWPDRIDYAVTLHPEMLADFLRRRCDAGLPMAMQTWAHSRRGPRGKPWSTVDRTTEDWAGSSGLLAVKIAREEGFDKIVLAGIPMEAAAGHVDRRKNWIAAHAFRRSWERRRDLLAPYVRSMSGWTKELFGPPTPEWLAA